MKIAVLFLAVFSAVTVGAYAQETANGESKHEAFPTSTFAVGFEKLFENPLFSWRADMGVDFVGYRNGKHNLTGAVRFSTVGARPNHGRIGIAGTAYGLEGCYRYNRTETNWFSVCDSHLSSHKTDELQALAREEIANGRVFPVIKTADINAISFTTGFAFVAPIESRFIFRFQPISFHYRGGAGFYDQPVYFASRFTLVKGRHAKLSLVTKHEFGNSSFNDGYLNLDLFPHGQEEGRAQLYIRYSPNHQIQTSINELVRRGGFGVGLKLIWGADAD